MLCQRILVCIKLVKGHPPQTQLASSPCQHVHKTHLDQASGSCCILEVATTWIITQKY